MGNPAPPPASYALLSALTGYANGQVLTQAELDAIGNLVLRGDGNGNFAEIKTLRVGPTGFVCSDTQSGIWLAQNAYTDDGTNWYAFNSALGAYAIQFTVNGVVLNFAPATSGAIVWQPFTAFSNTAQGNTDAVEEQINALQVAIGVLQNAAYNGGFKPFTGGPASAATTTALPANTYNNGAAGVGATLTGTTNGALPMIDGQTLAAGQRLWVQNEATAANNGLYVVTQTGNGSAPYILTRAIDANTPAALGYGYALVLAGTKWAGYGIGVALAAPNIAIGTTALNPVAFTGSAAVASAVAAEATRAQGAETLLKSWQITSAIAANGLMQYGGTDTVVPLIVDSSGNVIYGVNRTTGKAVLGISSTDPGVVAAIFQGVIKYAPQLQTYSGTDRLQPLVVDSNSGVVLGIDTVTGLLGGSGVVGLVSGASTQSGTYAPLQSGSAPQLRGWNGFVTYGQSLSEGLNAFPALSTSQPYSNLTFGSGPRSGKPGNSYGAVNTSPGTTTSRALFEDVISPAEDGSTTGGETVCSAAMNWACTRAAIDLGKLPSTFINFASAPGHGSYSITQLNSGAAWYGAYQDHVSGAHSLAVAASQTYALHAVNWMQGEADAENCMSRSTYASNFEALQGQLNTYAQGVTSQSWPVAVLTYQTPSCPPYGNAGQPGYPTLLAARANIVLAQNDAIAANDNIYLVGACYHLPFYSDGVHLNNIGQMWYGHYVGRAYKQLVIEGRVPDCIQPASATVKGTTLNIRFNVPRAPLVLDSFFVPAATNFGFEVIDDSGVATISAIQVVNNNTVTMTLGRALSTNPFARYALDYLGTGMNLSGGASGNLRDSTSDSFTYSSTTYPLWHVCPAFQLPVIALDPNS